MDVTDMVALILELLPLLVTIFAGGFFCCRRRAGALWMIPFILVGLLTCTLALATSSDDVPVVVRILIFLVWICGVVAAIAVPLARGAERDNDFSGPSNQDRFRSATASVVGTVIGVVLAGILLSVSPIAHYGPDYPLGGLVLFLTALGGTFVGALAGWFWAETHARV